METGVNLLENPCIVLHMTSGTYPDCPYTHTLTGVIKYTLQLLHLGATTVSVLLLVF